MKEMKERRFLKTLKFIPTLISLNQAGLALQSSQTPTSHSEHVKDSKHDGHRELELEFNSNTKEIINPSVTSKNDSHEAKYEVNDKNHPSLLDFEEKCPPGGNNSIILYTTSFRGIRKTFDDCNKIRFLLESFKVMYFERDVSMHMEFRDELWNVLRGKRVIPPRVFIKGRYIGGADEVIGLHEQGKLIILVKDIPVKMTNLPCKGCGNLRFVVCLKCNGSRKVFVDGEFDDDDDELCIRCSECNENGLVKCSFCC